MKRECPSNIVLFGFMGVGKTTVARELSSSYGFKLVETDALVVEASGLTIPELFNNYGVEHFRALETSAIISIQGMEGLIISTGGGAIESEANCNSLALKGISFALCASFDILWERIRGDQTTRPLAESYDALYQLYSRRKVLYDSIANPVSTEDTTPSVVAAAIFERYLLLGGLAPLS